MIFDAGFLSDSDDKFLRAGNKYLFDYNMQTAKALMVGNGKLTGSFKDAESKTISFDGLTGKNLDYALVNYEQTKVQNFIDEYKRNNPNADINSSFEKVSNSINSPGAPNDIIKVMEENFSQFNQFNFGNYQHRVILGQRLIDRLYKGKY